MAMEESETVSRIQRRKKTTMRKNDQKDEENNREAECFENGEREEGKTESSENETKQGENEDQSSRRGVMEVSVSVSGLGSDSDHSSCLISIEKSSSFETENSLMEGGVEEDLNYGNLHWKKLFGQVKKPLVWKISTISLLGGANGLSKKTQRKKMGRKSNSETAIDSGDFVMPKPSWRNFTYEELKQATNDFSSDKLIGKGGHAEVYKGCLSDGLVVAVKKIIKEKKIDEDKNGDFLAELGIIAHIDHPNAAKLIGFSADRGLHLVLQFLPYGSLATALHGSGAESLEWKLRYKVAVDVAEGLEYLHYSCQRRIIHRDITASNILLSEDYGAQISDFGLAKWLPEKWAHLVVSPIEGTFGYMAPEYFMHGLVNEKTDVFAFGVLLLELITGRRAVDSSRQSLVMWAKPLLEKNNVKEIADPRLGETYDIVEMERAMFTASNCINHLPNVRPNMNRVVQLLKGNNGVDMKQNSIAGRSLILDACDLDDYTSATYLNDLNRHMQLVMEKNVL